MPDWKRLVIERLPAGFDDPDVVEELAEHAQEVYRTARSAGRSENESLADVEAELTDLPAVIRAAHASRRRRLSRALDPVAAPRSSPVAAFGRDLRYALRALSARPGVTLLAVFTLTSVVPLVLLAIVAYRRTVLVAADPARADSLLFEMVVIMFFLVAVGLGAAIGLSLFVAGSVAAPLREVEAAMARVERGDLDARAPVVSNDEIGRVAEGFNRMLAGLRERDRAGVVTRCAAGASRRD